MSRVTARYISELSGIEVSGDEHGLSIALHVVVEHGLNLAEVASTVRNRVAYEVGRMTGLEI